MEQDKEMLEFYAAMREPEIKISESASDEQARLITDINWLLNGRNYEPEIPIKLVMADGKEFVCEKFLYREDRLWAERYSKKGDYWEQVTLDGANEMSLNKLYSQLIDEIF